MAGTNTTAPLIWTSEFDYNSGLESNANQEWKLVDAGNSTYYWPADPKTVHLIIIWQYQAQD